jgi:thiamine-monophosphate kinase
VARRPKSGEFDLIARYFAPLSAGQPGALGLRDDAALLPPSPGAVHVLTTDTLISGVHFLPDDPPALVARKLLRVNISDLAAMAAQPVAYLLALSLPREYDETWVEGFAAGLAQDQEEFGIGLLGGDTTAAPGPLSATITAIGEVPTGAELRRSGARPGDMIFVSGTIGDAALGLMVLAGDLSELAEAAAEDLIGRYCLPRPRVSLGYALRGRANAAADVSDGLVADLGHICAASGVGARIDYGRLPLSPAVRAVIAATPETASTVLSGGDDYELLFTCAPAAAADISAAAVRAEVPVTEIGSVVDGNGVTVIGEDGHEINMKSTGYRHF